MRTDREGSLFAVVMAGGRGTRFWPLSRRDRPKQFLGVVPGGTLLQETVARVLPLVPAERVLVVLAEDQREEAGRELPEVPPANFLVEPCGRNTAPAIGLSALAVSERDPDAVMIILPADHSIADAAEFRRVLTAASSAARRDDALVVLGVRPDRPETGYGYILPGEALPAEAGYPVQRVARFTEKPSREKAEALVREGYLWNSGMFVWRVAAIRRELARHLPQVDSALSALAALPPGASRDRQLREIYPRLPAMSIDYGVMEKTGAAVVVPCEFGWNDVGSWTALAGLWPKDASGNALRGQAVTLDSRGCVVWGGDRLVALVDLEGVVVVDTPDAVLVCRAASDQKVRDLVHLLETSSLDRYL
jgi:mannose-1-phosphate guanylyltransferase